MGCHEGKSSRRVCATPETLEILPPDQSFLHFFESNASLLYLHFKDRHFLRKLDLSPLENIDSKEAFKDAVSQLIESGEQAKALKIISACVWNSRISEETLHDVQTLISLLGRSPEADFHLLRFFFYLYKVDRSPVYEEKRLEMLRLAFRPILSVLDHEFHDSFEGFPYNLDVGEEREYAFGCFWLMHALDSNPISAVSLESVPKLFEYACLTRVLPPTISISILCFCLVYLKRSPGFPFETEVPTLPSPLEPESFELLLQCLGSFRLIPTSLMQVLLHQLGEVKLRVHDESILSFLSQETRLSALILYIQSTDSSLLKRVCKTCELIFFRRNEGKSAMKIRRQTVTQIVTALDISYLPKKNFPFEVIEALYKWQFVVGKVSDEFSERYLKTIAKEPNFSTDNDEVENIINQLVLYATYRRNAPRTKPVLTFLSKFLWQCLQEKNVLSETRIDLIMKITRSLPLIRDFILSQALKVRNELNIGLQLPDDSASEDHQYLTITSANIQILIKRLRYMTLTFPAFPQELQALVFRYMTWIQKHFCDGEETKEHCYEADEKERKQLIRECEDLTTHFNLDKVNLEFFSTVASASSAVYNSIVKHLRKLATKEQALVHKTVSEEGIKKFIQKWVGHVLLLSKIFEQPNIISLAFDTTESLMFRVYALTCIIQAFRKKKLAAKEEGRETRFSMFLRWVEQAQMSGFRTPLEREQCLINRVIDSKCLKEALDRLSLQSSHLDDFKERIFFVNLDFNKYSRFVTLGGFIVLNERLRDGSTPNDCLLMIMVAHELAHAARRQMAFPSSSAAQTEPSSPTAVDTTAERSMFCSTRSSSMRTDQAGMDGYSLDKRSEKKEGGKALECLLFGSVVQQLTDAQMQFLCRKKNWKHLGVDQFRETLEELGQKVGQRTIYYLRSDTGVYSSNRNEQCVTRD